MKCIAFRNDAEGKDSEAYWGNDGRNSCPCGHNAMDHNLRGRRCAECAKEEEMSFDPEKVERFEPDSMMTPRVADAKMHYRQYVRASDYDQLLKLYRQEKARAEALAVGVQKLLPLVIASPFSTHL